MQIQLQKPQIIKQFKRNGFNLDSNCLKQVTEFLSSSTNQQKSLKTLIKKLNEISVSSSEKFGQKMIKISIQILSQGIDSKFKTLQEIIEDVRRWSIMYLSPYETSEDRFFIQKPQPSLFKFDPYQVMQSDIKRFRQIQEATRELLKSTDWFVGMLYEDFSKMTAHQDGVRSKIILQNEANQLQIIFPNDFNHKFSLVPGCIYAVKGDYLQRNLVLTVRQIMLPPPLSQDKSSLLKLKFKKMCENIHQFKNELNFEAKDFYKYSTIYNEQRNLNKSTLIFGAVMINKLCIERIFKIFTQMEQSGNKVQCIIMMLDEGQHEEVDLKIWFKGVSVFVVPHVNSEGPRLLPKVPVLKRNFNATKVVTNPAKFSIYGRETIFLNLPLMKNLYEKNLFNSKQTSSSLNPNEMAKSLSELLFSQSTAHICCDIFPKQVEYFKLKQETLVFVSDKACRQLECSKDGKKCMFVSVGNFIKEGKFVCYMPKHKKSVQLSEEF